MGQTRRNDPQTQLEVVHDAMSGKWYQVKQAMVGPRNRRVCLGWMAQYLVLQSAMGLKAWVFINDLVLHNYVFQPNLLENVVITAAQRKGDFCFVESVILAGTQRFPELCLLEIVGLFSSRDGWLFQANQIAQLLPDHLESSDVVYKLWDTLRVVIKRKTRCLVLKAELLKTLTARLV